MVMLDVTTGLRRSEPFALKSSDVDFSNLRLDVSRSIYLRNIGDCKTEASRTRVAADLWLWKETSPYREPGDWIFASPRTQGKYPFWPDTLLQKVSFGPRHCEPESARESGDRIVIHAKKNGETLVATTLIVGTAKTDHVQDMKGMDMSKDQSTAAPPK